MEREIHTGKLSGAEFAWAASADDADIRALLRAVPMAGGLKIGFSREPSYFACPAPAGMDEHTLVARKDGRLISVGSFSERDVWLRGERARIGYLHGLRMAAGAGGSMRVLRDGYRQLAGRVRESKVTACFTSIDATNSRARRVLESRASGLPRYTKIADYLTRIVPVHGRGGGERDVRKVDLLDELTDFLNREAARYELALTWDACRWEALARSGFTPDQVCVVRRRGRIVAAAGVWDQSSWKQIVVHGYPPWLERLRPAVNLGARCFGRPGLPDAGQILRLGSVFPFAVGPDASGLLPDLWRGIEAVARASGVEWLALGLDADDPLWKMQRMKRAGINYRTIFYAINGDGFPDGFSRGRLGIVRPECATL